MSIIKNIDSVLYVYKTPKAQYWAITPLGKKSRISKSLFLEYSIKRQVVDYEWARRNRCDLHYTDDFIDSIIYLYTTDKGQDWAVLRNGKKRRITESLAARLLWDCDFVENRQIPYDEGNPYKGPFISEFK